MTTVYMLFHTYDKGPQRETKTIGIYSTPEKAFAVVENHRKLPGFKSYPNGFELDEVELDEPWSLPTELNYPPEAFPRP
jgi:homoserine kinase type II